MGKERVQLPSLAALAHNLNGARNQLSRLRRRRRRYLFNPLLPDGYSQIFRSHVFGSSGFWTMALLRYAAKFDTFLSLDWARVEGVGAQRKGSNFAIWQHWLLGRRRTETFHYNS